MASASGSPAEAVEGSSPVLPRNESLPSFGYSGDQCINPDCSGEWLSTTSAGAHAHFFALGTGKMGATWLRHALLPLPHACDVAVAIQLASPSYPLQTEARTSSWIPGTWCIMPDALFCGSPRARWFSCYCEARSSGFSIQVLGDARLICARLRSQLYTAKGFERLLSFLRNLAKVQPPVAVVVRGAVRLLLS